MTVELLSVAAVAGGLICFVLGFAFHAFRWPLGDGAGLAEAKFQRERAQEAEAKLRKIRNAGDWKEP